MLLAIDVGNTQTVVGVFEGETLLHRWRLATDKGATSDELRVKLAPLIQSERLSFSNFKGSSIACVVPTLTTAWTEALRRMVGTEPVYCTAESAAALLETDYPNPWEIGSDRIADAVAAKHLYGAPVLVVDFGTATNLEVVDSRGYFTGGVIAPGIETSAQALFSRATRLGAIELRDPGVAFGKNTEQAIQAGIVYGEADRVDGLISRIFEQLGYEAPVVATGGLAGVVSQVSRKITATNPDLTLEGLRLIYQSVTE